MNFKDVVEVGAAVITSLGGGGALVLGFSNYLGKIWADRALEKQRHEYSQLNIAFQNQLDMATRRLQVELDALVSSIISKRLKMDICRYRAARYHPRRRARSSVDHRLEV